MAGRLVGRRRDDLTLDGAAIPGDATLGALNVADLAGNTITPASMLWNGWIQPLTFSCSTTVFPISAFIVIWTSWSFPPRILSPVAGCCRQGD